MGSVNDVKNKIVKYRGNSQYLGQIFYQEFIEGDFAKKWKEVKILSPY